MVISNILANDYLQPKVWAVNMLVLSRRWRYKSVVVLWLFAGPDRSQKMVDSPFKKPAAYLCSCTDKRL